MSEFEWEATGRSGLIGTPVSFSEDECPAWRMDPLRLPDQRAAVPRAGRGGRRGGAGRKRQIDWIEKTSHASDEHGPIPGLTLSLIGLQAAIERSIAAKPMSAIKTYEAILLRMGGETMKRDEARKLAHHVQDYLKCPPKSSLEQDRRRRSKRRDDRAARDNTAG